MANAVCKPSIVAPVCADLGSTASVQNFSSRSLAIQAGSKTENDQNHITPPDFHTTENGKFFCRSSLQNFVSNNKSSASTDSCVHLPMLTQFSTKYDNIPQQQSQEDSIEIDMKEKPKDIHFPHNEKYSSNCDACTEKSSVLQIFGHSFSEEALIMNTLGDEYEIFKEVLPEAISFQSLCDIISTDMDRCEADRDGSCKKDGQLKLSSSTTIMPLHWDNAIED